MQDHPRLTRAYERLMASPWMDAGRLAHLALALWLLSLFMVVQVRDKRLAEQWAHAALTGLWENAEGPVLQLHIASSGVQVHIATPWRKHPASDAAR